MGYKYIEGLDIRAYKSGVFRLRLKLSNWYFPILQRALNLTNYEDGPALEAIIMNYMSTFHPDDLFTNFVNITKVEHIEGNNRLRIILHPDHLETLETATELFQFKHPLALDLIVTAASHFIITHDPDWLNFYKSHTQKDISATKCTPPNLSE